MPLALSPFRFSRSLFSLFVVLYAAESEMNLLLREILGLAFGRKTKKKCQQICIVYAGLYTYFS